MTTQISDYAVLAMQSYDFLDENAPNVQKDDLKVNFTLEGFNGWSLLGDQDAHAFGLQSAGFSAEVFEKENQYVISFRGTDDWTDSSWEDWIGPDADINGNIGFITGRISTQLTLAVKYVEELLSQGISLESITFTGHSLGGGLASAVAALYDRPAYVFDPAPINTSVDAFDFLAFTESIRGVAASFVTDATLEVLIGDVAYSKVTLAITSIATLLASVGGEPLLKGMASFDWTEIAPSNWLDQVEPLPPLPAQPDLVIENLDALLAWADAVNLYEVQLAKRYQQLLTFAEKNVAIHAVDGEVLQELAAPFSGAFPSNNGTELIDIGDHELNAVDLHSQPLLALTQVRDEDGKEIIDQLFKELPGLVDNLFNGDLTGFDNHKSEKDYSIFMRMLMDISDGNNQFYEDFFTEYKRIADADFSGDRNPVSEYFVQSGLIELGARVRQDSENKYIEGKLSAPGEFFGASESYIYQQTFQHPESAINGNVETLDSYFYDTLSLNGYWAQFEAAYGHSLFFDGTSPSDDLTSGFNLYNSFRAVVVAASDSGSAAFDMQSTLDSDEESLKTLAENEDPSQKAEQGWFFLGSKSGADTVNGSDKSDLIHTQGGGDIVKAGDGDDVVLGGDGKDEIDGEEGNDVLVGGAENDTFIGSIGNDIIFGGDVGSTAQGGVDKADFSEIDKALSVSFSLEGAGLLSQVTVTGADVNTKMYSIDELLLSSHDDTLTIDNLEAATQDFGLTIDAGTSDNGDTLDLSALSDGVTLIGQGGNSFVLNGTNIKFTSFEKVYLTNESDVVDYSGPAEIYLGSGADIVAGAGAGSVIYSGPGGAGDADVFNLSNMLGSLIADADAFDNVFAYGSLAFRGTYTKNVESENPYFTAAGFLKIGLNSNGSLVLGDYNSKDGDDASFLYLANFNNNPLAIGSALTAGIRLGEIGIEVWRLIKGRESSIGNADGLRMWDFITATIKDIVHGADAGGVDPLVFDLDGDGLELTPMVTGVSPMFDMDGDGFAEHSGWVAPDDGFLAMDINGNGLIDDVTELFGGAGQSGFAALAEFDQNEDGVIDANDAVFADLRIWRDLDGDAVTDEGELYTLADLDITSIDLAPTEDGSANALNIVERTGTFTREDGTTGEVGDVVFRVNNYDTVYTGDTTVAPEVAATMPNIKGHGTLADLQVSITLDGIDGALAQTINSVLPTLNVPDMDLLSERAFAILEAWAQAAPEGQSFGSNPDTPALISRANGGLEVLDFAVQVTEQITLQDGSEESVTYWKRAGDTPITDSNGDEIDYPSFVQVMAHQPGGDSTSWEIVSSAELTFIERYFGEDIPIDQAGALTGSAVSGVGSLLERTELLVEQLTLRLAMQGGLKEYFDGVEYSVEEDRFAPSTDYELIPFFTKIFEAAPADAAGTQVWLDDWKPLVDTLLSDYERPGVGRITAPFIFTNVVAAYENVGLPISIADAAESLGVSRDIVDVGSGERTGTDSNEIFYMSSGDDVIESKDGGDVFVLGKNFGNDVINDYEEGSDSFDTIRFAHLTPDDVVATRDGKDLILTVAETGDTVRVSGQFHDINYSLLGGTTGPYQGIEEIVFATGEVWGELEIAKAVSHPQDNDESLIGTDHADAMDGGAGDDYLQGGDHTDLYIFDAGYGIDTIEEGQTNILSPGEDFVLFGEGLTRDDISFYREGDSNDLVINTTTGDQLTILGQFAGSKSILGESWFDRVEFFQIADQNGNSLSFDHADIMRDLVRQAKTDGDDTIYGFVFDDVLDGGAGNDYLSGGDKNDTYKFGFGYGSDVFDEGISLNLNFETIDKVLFGEGVTADDVTLERDEASADLTVKLSDGSQFTILRQFLGDNIGGNHFFAIETFEFEDGTIWDQEFIYNKFLTDASTSGDDSIHGFWRNDILDGGAGNDYLNGDDGNDTYIFGFGYGEDIIFDDMTSIFTNENDRLLFGEGVLEEHVTWSRDGNSNDLIATLTDGSQVTIKGQFTTNNFGNRLWEIEHFEFADGQSKSVSDIQEELIQETSGDDIIYGFDSADVFSGSAGNDTYYGGEGGDTYHFGLGSGHDRIFDDRSSAFINANDKIVFGEGVTAADVTVTWADEEFTDLVLSLNGSDSITIEDYRSLGLLRYREIEEFEFANGSVWQTSDLFEKYLQGAVTSGDDLISGFNTADTIEAGAGNDTIYGQEDNDTLIGGVGDDILNGGKHSDVYRYDLGDGADTIIETANNGASDKLILDEGISADEVTVTRGTSDLNEVTLSFSDGGSILLKHQLNDFFDQGVEQIEFADGTIWAAEDLNRLLAENSWTDGDDTIHGSSGTNDYLFAGAGNDTVYGYSGEDTITGGLGDDVLNGGDYSDVYRYASGDGADTVLEGASEGTLDRLILEEGISASEVTVTRGVSDLNEVTLSFSDGGSILLKNQLNEFFDQGVEQIEFADGTVWTRTDLRSMVLGKEITAADDVINGFNTDDVIDAGSGADTVNAGDGKDDITGGLGDDVLNGGDDTDIYRYELGDGADTIIESASNGTLDRLILGEGITADEVTVTRGESDLNEVTLSFSDGGSILLKNQMNEFFDQGVEQIEFADGTVWTRTDLRSMVLGKEITAADDVINGFNTDDVIDAGSGADTVNAGDGKDDITGGLGDDVLNGGDDSDIYRYDLGDGADTIIESASNGTLDRLILGEAITADEVTVTRGESDLNEVTLSFSDGGSILLKNQLNEFFDQGVEQIEFADGTLWTRSDLRTKVLAVEQTAGDDVIEAFNGADTIEGGRGDDLLHGKDGSDTYVFNRGDNQDVIDDNGKGDTDRLVINGYAPGEVSLFRLGTSNDLYLFFLNSDDQITIKNTLAGDAADQIEQIEFEDGTVWDTDYILANVVEHDPLVANDDALSLIFEGTPLVISADELFANDTHSETHSLSMVSVSADSEAVVEVNEDGDIVLTPAEDFAGDITLTYTVTDGVFVAQGNAVVTVSQLDEIVSHDTITGTSGDDLILGALGDDQLHGRDGSDTYVFRRGDGVDVIEDNGYQDTDRLVIQNYTPNEVIISRDGNSDTAIVTFVGTSDQIKLVNTLDQSSTDQIEQIEFDDGTIWTMDHLRATVLASAQTDGDDTIYGFDKSDEVLNGGAGNDYINGQDGSNTLTGGLGDDTLNGDDGSDTYIFSRGDGVDVIEDNGYQDTDRLVIQNYTPNEVIISRDGNSDTAIVTFVGTSDQIKLVNTLDQSSTDQIEQIEFDDGTIWTMDHLRATVLASAQTDGDDTIYGFDKSDEVLNGGAGNDYINGQDGSNTLTGGLGDDTLNGEDGSDTYIFSRGDGVDVIEDNGYQDTDRLVIQNYTPNEVIISRDGNSDTAILTFVGTSDQIKLVNTLDQSSTDQIEQIEFDDGTIWTMDHLRATVLASAQTDGDDTIYGFDKSDEVLNGGAGNDYINGQDGSNTLTGGLGDDTLNGEDGSDTYIFSRGDDVDVIEDNGYQDTDRLVIQNYTPDEVLLSRDGSTNTLVLTFADTSDQITIINTLGGSSSDQIEQIEFDDGTVWTMAEARQFAMLGTDADETIVGFSGDDKIAGGSGDDILTGGSGNDTFRFKSGEVGHDTITDFSAGAGSDDVIEFDNSVFADVAGVLAAAADDGSDTTITIDSDTSIVLNGVLVADLHQDDFNFV